MSIQNPRQISDVKVLLAKGVDGSGIESIEKTGTSGLVDTYTITLSSGGKTTFTVTNGKSIVNIAKTSTSGLVDTYTVTYNDSTTSTFDVTNGNGISNIAKTSTSGRVDTYTITFTNGTTSTFTVTNGLDGGMPAKIVVTSDVGATVSVTSPSGISLTMVQVAGTNNQWEGTTTEYGIHTVSSVLYGVTETNTVNVDACKVFNVTVTHDHATITVNYSNEFKGLTVSCTDGINTYTQTAPSNANTMDFFVYNTGTWTVSAVYNSQTYSDTATVTALNTTQTVSLSVASVIKLAFHYSETDSDPNSVTYPSGYANSNFTTPFAVDLSTGVPNYGDWDFTDPSLSWLLPKPCMLKYDGTVDYYLDPSDYTKKVDGITASDVANSSYGGNAMMEWGQDGKKIYWKIVPDNDGNGFTFVVANDPDGDTDLKPWNHYNCDGAIADHFYTAIYTGGDDGTKLRSISGMAYYVNKTAAEEIDSAKANNQTAKEFWNIGVYADYIFIALLCVLISKSLDSQSKFGYGYANTAHTTVIPAGSMNDKGLFYGESTGNYGVKIFGIENFYGNILQRIAGYIYDSGTIKIKLTYGQEDGSTVDGYNLTGNGYISQGQVASTTTGFASHMNVTNKGLTVNNNVGSDSTYYCDGCAISASATIACVLVGGDSNDGTQVGIFHCRYNRAPVYVNERLSVTLSCKPLAS